MEYLKSEGIVLKGIAYKESDRIVTLFTPYEGLLPLYVRGVHKNLGLFNSLSRGEYIYTPGRKELFQFQEGSLLDVHSQLRDTWEALESAHLMGGALLLSQISGKEAPLLYALFVGLLQLLPQALSPCSLLSIFQLKILKHEGVFQTHSCCSVCDIPLKESYLRHGGELFCQSHAPQEAIEFTPEENHLLVKLAESRVLTALQLLSLPQDLSHSISLLFHQVYPLQSPVS